MASIGRNYAHRTTRSRRPNSRRRPQTQRSAERQREPTRSRPPVPRPKAWSGFPAARSGWAADDASMPDAKPVHEVTVSGFWMDRTEVTNRQFARFVKETAYRHDRRAPARPQGLSRCAAGKARPGLDRLHAAGRPGVARRPAGLVALRSRRELAASRGTDNHDRRERRLSGRPDLLVRRRRVCQLGRQAAADRGGMGARGARRQGAFALCVGR